MTVLIYICIITSVIYLIFISFIHTGWHRLNIIKKDYTDKKTGVSIIIACRNEQETIPVLLKNLNNQKYPASFFEVIVIDDHSDDNSISVIESIQGLKYPIQLYKLPSTAKGKKQAIGYGIDRSQHDVIITLDADVTIGTEWLSTMVSYHLMHNAEMIIGPVVLTHEKGIFSRLQSLEWLSLIGSGAGSAGIHHPISCNGANLLYKKSNFYRFNGNDHFPSGDDIMLMLNMKKVYAKKIFFLKSRKAIAFTKPRDNIKEFLNQRKRWTSKSKYYEDPGIIFSALIVFVINLLLLILIIGALFIPGWIHLFIFLFSLKLIADFPFLFSVTSFFKKRKLLNFFLLAEIIYFIYVPYTAIAGLIMPFNWKKRSYYPWPRL